MARKKISEEEIEELQRKTSNEWDFFQNKNALAMRKDIAQRFKDYDEDTSIGNMYQRKKKSTKSKTKRKHKSKK